MDELDFDQKMEIYRKRTKWKNQERKNRLIKIGNSLNILDKKLDTD